jgi:hypothetical protein
VIDTYVELRADDVAMMDYAANCTHEDPLSAARGMFVGSIISLMLWALILTTTARLG